MESWFPGQISGPESLEWEGCIQDTRLPKNSWPHEVLISENSHEDFHLYPGPSSTQYRILHPKNKQDKNKPSHRQTSFPQTLENTTLHSLAHQREKTHLLPSEGRHKSFPSKAYHWNNLTHQGQKPKGRRNTALKVGKRRLTHGYHDSMVLAQKQKYKPIKED